MEDSNELVFVTASCKQASLFQEKMQFLSVIYNQFLFCLKYEVFYRMCLQGSLKQQYQKWQPNFNSVTKSQPYMPFSADVTV